MTVVIVFFVALIFAQLIFAPESESIQARDARLAEEARNEQVAKNLADTEARSKLNSQRDSWARMLAETHVRDQLKAPRTAEFSGYGETKAAHMKGGRPNEWIVQGYVDAENDFGARIRNRYEVVIEFEEGKSDSYRINSSIIN